MPDFSRPEYRTYIELCRALRLEREFELPDQFLRTWDDDTDVFLSSEPDDEGGTQPTHTSDKLIWLPDVSDWLEMLEASGDYGGVQVSYGFNQRGDVGVAVPNFELCLEHAVGPTVEEALANLALAVGAVLTEQRR